MYGIFSFFFGVQLLFYVLWVWDGVLWGGRLKHNTVSDRIKIAGNLSPRDAERRWQELSIRNFTHVLLSCLCCSVRLPLAAEYTLVILMGESIFLRYWPLAAEYLLLPLTGRFVIIRNAFKIAHLFILEKKLVREDMGHFGHVNVPIVSGLLSTQWE